MKPKDPVGWAFSAESVALTSPATEFFGATLWLCQITIENDDLVDFPIKDGDFP